VAKQRASRAKSVVSGVGTASGTSTAAAVGGSIFAATGTAGTAAAMKELQWRVKMEPVWKAPKRRKGIDAAVRKILRKHPQATNSEVEMLIPEHEGMTVVAKGEGATRFIAISSIRSLRFSKSRLVQTRSITSSLRPFRATPPVGDKNPDLHLQ
jgi:hypothetical protein